MTTTPFDKTVLVTGATGFVGRALCRTLADKGYALRAATRGNAAMDGCVCLPVGDIDGGTDWSSALAGVGCVVHLAARVHVMRESAADPLAEFHRTNVAGTQRLALAAAQAGVRRLVFLSSVKVNGEATTASPFAESDTPAPADPYGISKWEAENALRGVAGEMGLEIVILRPPLIYGPGVKANFRRMLALAASGLPLPFASIDNRRSLVFLGNLVDAIATCLIHPRAAGETFLISDGEDLSTPDLLRRMRQAMGFPARLMPVPPSLLQAGGRLLRRKAEVGRLVGSLQVDSAKLRTLLSWQPPCSVDAGLRETCEDFLASKRRSPAD